MIQQYQSSSIWINRVFWKKIAKGTHPNHFQLIQIDLLMVLNDKTAL